MIIVFGMVCVRSANSIVWTETALLPTLSLLLSANQTSALLTLIPSEVLLLLQCLLSTDGVEAFVSDMLLQ